MITILSIINLFTIFHWLRLWDRALKNRVSIRTYLPSDEEPIRLFFLMIPTAITIGSILYLMVTYLP